jgi:hypothetical protein
MVWWIKEIPVTSHLRSDSPTDFIKFTLHCRMSIHMNICVTSSKPVLFDDPTSPSLVGFPP